MCYLDGFGFSRRARSQHHESHTAGIVWFEVDICCAPFGVAIHPNISVGNSLETIHSLEVQVMRLQIPIRKQNPTKLIFVGNKMLEELHRCDHQRLL